MYRFYGTTFKRFVRYTTAGLLIMLLSVSHISASEPFPYPEGNWNEEQLFYFDFLSTGQYIDYIQNDAIREISREQFIDNFYTFRDLDSNGVLDLILWHGYTGADGEMQTFTIDKGEILYTGSAPCDGTGTHLFCADHDNDFFLASYDGDSVYVNGYRMISNRMTCIAEDAMIPNRWYLVEWVGSLPLIPANDSTVSVSSSEFQESVFLDGPFAEFMEYETFAFFVEDPILFDNWIQMDESCSVRYWLDDIENNDTYELLVWMGVDGGPGEVMVFTVYHDWTEYIGSVPCSGSDIGISGSNTVPGFLIVSNDGGMEQITMCECYDGMLEITAYYVPEGSGWYGLDELDS